jgi:WD40 repeat protein
MNGSTYTAPQTIGTYHLVATSTADSRLSFSVIIAVVPHGFLPVGDLNLPRTGHTATLLPDGKVLVAGGDPCWIDDGSCPLQETELFDPDSGTFQLAATMVRQRAFHAAALLPNGKVLLTGGGSTTAELYDPATNSFAATGIMSTDRFQHTATLLPNGKVLIAGGHLNNDSMSSAELYDPTTGSFSPTGVPGMSVPRSVHTATHLPDGRVLIAGGQTRIGAHQSTAGIHASAELYDPATESFVMTGNMSDARVAHAAVRVDNGTVLVTGGISPSERLDTAEIYNPATGAFSTTTRMLLPRWAHVAVLLQDGTVLVTGGPNETLENGGQVLGFRAEIYDAATASFSQTGSMRAGHRFLPAAVVLTDGRVLLTGALEEKPAEVYQ